MQSGYNKKLKMHISRDFIEDIKNIKGFDCDVEEELIKILKKEFRKKKLKKICGLITEEKQK